MNSYIFMMMGFFLSSNAWAATPLFFRPFTNYRGQIDPITAKIELISADPNNPVSGNLYLEQQYSSVLIKGVIKGLKRGKHGFHIHATGDLGDGCKAAGGHFNPFQKNHGGPLDVERHVGDLGNIYSYSELSSTYVFKVDHMISLNTTNEASIIDRALVIHGGEDDLGRGGNSDSLKTGNAGPRVACGIIKKT